MNEDSFKHLELLFHELSDLPIQDRADRLGELEAIDPHKAEALRSLLSAATSHPEFLNADRVDKKLPDMIEIALDGSTVLAERYTILELIGIGGSSTVFCAQATNPDRKVAVKMLRFGLNSARARDRFDEESQSLAKLTHPHIAHIYETGIYTQDGIRVPWIAMELIPQSRTIIEYIKANSPNEAGCIDLFQQVCHAIQAAHELGVLHLDLNASNILIDSHGYPKIIDFGLAGLEYSTASRRGDGATRHIGTRTSMAPEQTLFGAVPFDERTDIYALGILLTEMLTGHQLQAFAGLDDEAARKQIAHGKAREQLDSISTIPSQYLPAIDRMLRVDPHDRFQSVADMLKQIEQNDHPKKTIIPYKSIAAVVLMGVLISSFYLNKQTPQDTTQPNAIALPPEVAIEISKQNPRDHNYSPNQRSIIESLSSAAASQEHLDPVQASELQSTLADNYRISGDYEQAINHYLQSIEFLDKKDNAHDRNWVLLSMSDLLLFLGRSEQASHSLEQIDRTVSSSPLFLLDLGIAETQAYTLLNEYDNARRQLEYTTGFLEQLPADHDKDRIDRMIKISDIYIDLNEKGKALSLLADAKSFALGLASDSTTSVAMIDVAIANATYNRDRPSTLDAVEHSMQQAIASFEVSNDQFHAQWARRQLGNMYLNADRALDAIKMYSIAESNLSALLGENHHETILCRAYYMLAKISAGFDVELNTQAYEAALRSLTETLGGEHAVVKSLRDAAQRILPAHGNSSP